MLHRWIAAAFVAALGLAAFDRAHAADTAHKPVAKHRRHAPPAHDPLADRYIDVAGFGEVAIYRPKIASKGLALFASGDGGWNLGVLDMAHEAAAAGFWVAGFNTPKFLKALDDGDAECSDADGLIAKLGASLVQTLDLPLDTKPVVIGYSSGATVVYAALAADAGRRFGGGISLGFCPDLLIKKPFCAGAGGLTQQKQQVAPFGYVFDKRETVDARWRILQGEADTVCDPKFAPEFAEGQADAKAVLLPKVGHGFGVPKNWMAQYRESLQDVVEPKP